MTKDAAIQLAKSGWWRGRPDEEVARFQLNEPLLCMDFSAFQKAVEGALGRPVWTHGFVDPERLIAEMAGDEPKPEDPNQYAVDSLAALLVSMGKDPDTAIVVVDPEAN